MLPNTKFIPFILAASFIVSTAYAEDDAVSMLNKMDEAVHQLEYSGKLVFIKKGDEPKTLAIEHTLDGAVEKETITPLDASSGKPIESSSRFSLNTISRITPEMKNVYSFDMGSMSKVAGRPCRIIIARPKDRKRYLQKYCIDQEWGVLLQYSLTNQEHETVERFMFTDFTVYQPSPAGDRVNVKKASKLGEVGEIAVSASKMAAPISLAVTNSHSPSVTPEEEDASLVEKNEKERDNYSEWIFDPLPAGFKMVSTAEAEDLQGEEHIIVTDGLSSVSIFIMEGRHNQDEGKNQSAMESGALNILTQFKDDYTITLLGEVPKVTLQDIFAGIKRTTIK